LIIIGAGIVGLATALKVQHKKPGTKITILEKEPGPALHQTGNNSGVIHAGVYYKPGSLKAINCRKGYTELIEFCEQENIAFDLCGKLIVATRKDEMPRLEILFERSKQNGLLKVKQISGEKIKEFEPCATGIAALHVPYTGIVDYKEVAQKYAEIITQRYGCSIEYNSKVEGIRKKNGKIEVVTGEKAFTDKFLVNTAGLFSDKIAKMTDDKLDVRIIPFRGEYLQLKQNKTDLVNNLIYPVPDPNFPFLGVHFTRMINGGVEAGPNAVWAFSREGYKFKNINPGNMIKDLAWPGFRKVMHRYWRMGIGEYYRSFNKNALVKEMQRMVPEITKADIEPGGAGVRAQACSRNGGLIDDFLIQENKWAINVLNSPSPAATASLAIGDSIADLIIKRLK
jgi:L-2-hydroxyglutarate oxidase